MRGEIMQFGIIFGLLFGFVITFFAVLNTETVSLNYFFGQVDSSVAVLMIASAVLGAAAVGFFGLIKQIGTGFAIWDFKNKERRLSKEVEALKDQKRALSDDLAYIQAEYENTVKQKEMECEVQVKKLEAGQEEYTESMVEAAAGESTAGEPEREE
jgi:lipopolysaccharide assembly protein A